MPATLANTFLFILQGSALADLRYGVKIIKIGQHLPKMKKGSVFLTHCVVIVITYWIHKVLLRVPGTSAAEAADCRSFVELLWKLSIMVRVVNIITLLHFHPEGRTTLKLPSTDDSSVGLMRIPSLTPTRELLKPLTGFCKPQRSTPTHLMEFCWS